MQNLPSLRALVGTLACALLLTQALLRSEHRRQGERFLNVAGGGLENIEPLAAFSRFIGGRWKMTMAAGTDTYDSWHWGPGEQSIRSMRVGTLPTNDPWSVVTVYYWHPTLKEVRLLSVGSVWRGVGEGWAKFEADSAETQFTLHQVGGPSSRPRGPRELRERWTFAGPDKYHDELSEKVRGEYEFLSDWDRARVDAATPAEPVKVPLLALGGTPSEFLRPLEKVLGQARSSIALAAAPQRAGEARTRTQFEFVPYADAIYGRVEAIGADGVSSHELDVYLYHHTGLGSLRCLALSSPSGEPTVYEGEIVPSANGRKLTLVLKEHSTGSEATIEVSIDFEQDGLVRVWRIDGTQRSLVIDVVHQDPSW